MTSVNINYQQFKYYVKTWDQSFITLVITHWIYWVCMNHIRSTTNHFKYILPIYVLIMISSFTYYVVSKAMKNYKSNYQVLKKLTILNRVWYNWWHNTLIIKLMNVTHGCLYWLWMEWIWFSYDRLIYDFLTN